ncbi:interferon gamma receptor 1 [Tachyglossus aculeatus]|uniref:interferon gamma receptor 1 n=1 Tax=Tachyglossus aculeatus TaxID=9261 RepID=UPI0018F73F17|nr:interferon gamma receptor 1 [Tachyglossus aculeatus]
MRRPGGGPGVPSAIFVFLAFLPLSRPGLPATTGTQAPASVPMPVNVKIESYNWNPLVSWDFPNVSGLPLFTVEILNYNNENWMKVRNCSGISAHSCYILTDIMDSEISHWARVKASIGGKESDYAKSKDFVLKRNGKIGQFKLDVTTKDDKIIVDIFYPPIFADGSKKISLFDVYDDITCMVYCSVDGDESEEEYETECDFDKCNTSIQILSGKSEYCIRAQLISENWEIKSEETERHCLHLPPKSPSDAHVTLPIALAALVSIVLIIVFAYQLGKRSSSCQRGNIRLPKSLVSIVRNFNSRSILETKSETKYVSILTCQPAPPHSVKELVEEPFTPVTEVEIIPAEDSVGKSEQDTPSQETSNPTEVTAVEEGATETSSDSHPSSKGKDSYFQSNCSLSSHSEPSSHGSGSCSTELDSITVYEPAAEVTVQDPLPLRNTNVNFGYDKPHVLVDLIVDDGAGSVIGYRPSEESAASSSTYNQELQTA